MSDGLKLYTDVQIAASVAAKLGKRGVDVVHCQEVGVHDAKTFGILSTQRRKMGC